MGRAGESGKKLEQAEQKNETTDFKNLSGGLEILVQLAEKGEIDPWDIDIIELTDKYLAALDKSPRENLLNAGRAIFFASVLLRLKSDILLNISNETLQASQETYNFFPEDELLANQDGVHLDISKLESYLVRSSLAKQQRKRKISLGDLIFALQQAEEEEERRALRAKLKAERAFTILPPEMPDDMLEITQDEDIDEFVEKIEAIIQEHLTEDKPITLSFLCEILNDKLKPFLSLLFLANVQKIVLEQKEFYGEIFIHKSGTILKEKGIIEKIKDKVRAGLKPAPTAPTKRRKKKETKVIEVTTDSNNEVVDLTTKPSSESEVTSHGNNS